MVKRVTILGGGESGYGVAVLGKKMGYNVFLSDSGTLSDRYRDALTAEGIAFEEDTHTVERACAADVAVKSPGIPDTAKVVVALKEAGVKVVSEMEFAAKYCTAKIISITGSNGKTTTATLTHKILSEGGVNVALAGNIGDSFALSVAKDSVDWYVLELSSFQLDGCFSFRSDIAVITNITPDHLDRYEYDMAKYAMSKFRVLRNQTHDDLFIYNSNDSVTLNYVYTEFPAARTVNIQHPEQIGGQGGYMSEDGSEIVCSLEGREVRIPIKDIPLKGQHNYANIMDSVLIALRVGVDESSIKKSVCSFGGVEHRLELVERIGGVTYINDSKATNVDSAWYALDSMTTPTIWIAGGTDKGNDYTSLLPLARTKVKALVCMGKDNNKLIEAFSGVVPHIYNTHSLEEAITKITEITASGDTVLLSPAAASFDLFKNYEDRGEQFKLAVKALK